MLLYNRLLVHHHSNRHLIRRLQYATSDRPRLNDIDNDVVTHFVSSKPNNKLNNKLKDLEFLLAVDKPYIVYVTGIWFKPSTTNSCIYSSECSVFRKDCPGDRAAVVCAFSLRISLLLPLVNVPDRFRSLELVMSPVTASSRQ